MDALRAAAGRRRRHHAVGRRAAPGRAVPAAAVAARPAAARRAHQPPRRRVGGVARALPAATTRAPSSPSPTTATSSTTWPAGSSSSTAAGASRSRATTRAGSSRSRRASRQEEKQRLGPAAHPRARAGVGAHGAEGPPGQGQGPPRRLRASCWPRRRRPSGGADKLEIVIPSGRAPRRLGDRGRRRRQGLRRPAAHRRPDLHAAAGRHRRRHRPQRRRQDHAVPHDHRRTRSPTRARSRSAPPSSSPTSTRAATPSTPTRPSTRRSPAAATTHEARQPRDATAGPTSASFNFKGSDQQKKVGVLSGGERNRVHLAKMLKEGGNVLLLDEPTNDLDVDTLRALEDALEAFAGCAVVISHDRWFLDRIATHILAFEGDRQVRWFEGNFTEYEALPPARSSAPTPTSRTASSTSRSSANSLADVSISADPVGLPRGLRADRHPRHDRVVDQRPHRHRGHVRARRPCGAGAGAARGDRGRRPGASRPTAGAPVTRRRHRAVRHRRDGVRARGRHPAISVSAGGRRDRRRATSSARPSRLGRSRNSSDPASNAGRRWQPVPDAERSVEERGDLRGLLERVAVLGDEDELGGERAPRRGRRCR